MNIQFAIREILKSKVAIALVAIAVLGGIVSVALLVGKSRDSKSGQTVILSGPEEALEDLTVSGPIMDFSVSPLGDIGLASFDLGSGPSGSLFGNIGLNTDFRYDGSVSLSVPEVQISAPTNYNIQIPSQPTIPPVEMPVEMPAEIPTGGGGQAAPAVDASTCAQFSGVPSCSYIPDPNGQALCEQCRAAGY